MNWQGVSNFLSQVMLSRRVTVFLTVAAILSCVATYVVLIKKSNDINAVYWLLNLDLVLLLLLGGVIARRIARLWGERRRGIAGAKLHVRLVMIFGLLAAAPAIMMAIFSSIFLYLGIYVWFNDRVSTAIHESLEVAQAYLTEHQQVIRADVLAMANDLNREVVDVAASPEAFNRYMETQSQLRNLPEAMIMTSSGNVLARSRLSFTLELDRLPQRAMEEAMETGDVVILTGGRRDRIRALVKLDKYLDGYLYVGRLVDADVLAHIQTTENAVREYTNLQGRRHQLQVAVTVIFVVMSLILLLSAVWAGLVFAEQLVTPIGALILAAERIRTGAQGVRVQESKDDDEIALLGRVFNRMSGQIEGQRDELVTANRMLDERRRFTEAVLSGASSGVIGIDAAGQITLANARAEELLSTDKDDTLVGRRLADFIPEAAELLSRVRETPDRPASLEMEFAADDGPRRTLFLRITTERGGDGTVATIDDISALVSAQRKAAWADIARRIAHEIKNPLTPIQLSAERLKRKYLPQISDDPETFEKCTETIVRQVTQIGHMVNEFSAYARMPVALKRPENIIDVCQDALILQRQAWPDIRFDFAAPDTPVAASVDRSQLTQVLTNLLQNAIDSIRERQQHDPAEGRVAMSVDMRGGNVVVTVEDNGLGLPEKDRSNLMEPYVSTKKKGSGLGLAIVKKIMEEHDGSVLLEDSAQNATGRGVKATIIFPMDVKT